MTEVSPTPEEEAPDRFEGLPEDWSASALETYAQVEESLTEPSTATLAVLFEACALIARADECDAQVRTDGLMIDGYRSRVAHPLIAEARHARSAAMEHLRKMGAAPGQSPASAAGSALNQKRWHGRTPARRGRESA